MADAAYGAFVLPIHFDFVQVLEFAQFQDLDVRDFRVFGMNILVVYCEADFFILMQWLHHPTNKYMCADYLVF